MRQTCAGRIADDDDNEDWVIFERIQGAWSSGRVVGVDLSALCSDGKEGGVLGWIDSGLADAATQFQQTVRGSRAKLQPSALTSNTAEDHHWRCTNLNW